MSETILPLMVWRWAMLVVHIDVVQGFMQNGGDHGVLGDLRVDFGTWQSFDWRRPRSRRAAPSLRKLGKQCRQSGNANAMPAIVRERASGQFSQVSSSL